MLLTAPPAPPPAPKCTVQLAQGGSGATSARHPGTCTIKATQNGNAMYDSAPAVKQSFTVTP